MAENQLRIVSCEFKGNKRYEDTITVEWDVLDDAFDDLTDDERSMWTEDLLDAKKTGSLTNKYYLESLPQKIVAEIEFDCGDTVKTRTCTLDLEDFWHVVIPGLAGIWIAQSSLSDILHFNDEVDLGMWEDKPQDVLHGYDLHNGYLLKTPVIAQDPIRLLAVNNADGFRDYNGDFNKFIAEIENDGWVVE